MGQAKLRGSKEQRIAQAMQRKEFEYRSMGLYHKSLDDICQEFDIPVECEPKGYAIYVYDKEQFLKSFEVYKGMAKYSYCSMPGEAMINNDLEKIAPIARRLSAKFNTEIWYLFEDEKQYQAVPVITIDKAI